MPPKFVPRHQVHVSALTRLKAWWNGVDNAEALARYGEQGMLASMWRDWKGTLIVLGCVFTFVVGRLQSNRANYFLDNIELNRQKYYRKDFVPEYVEGAPSAVYDGARGYSTKDPETGLMINADNKFSTSETREELFRRVDSAEVTDSMVEAAERVLSSRRYNR
ncbi:hypothetical protein AGDE_00911 [Angomonas deanei]|uniref:Uncharacterized protein n=1 Tax=Angomonas deanei TaxID=59799 RepID=S9VJN3_9TRYP|nr:hypothetical protein AGDE_04844 [Angomonas deanei]EPY43012.1 hypothetical protein AGDE_00911 [Angomonas deanei]CAD2220285.1 hypothetical protein, conserved [Angomonas deanei]|eukprot:EPY39085.1 hypothetical protein AGDE_04844 [Angomonas deanei]